MRHLARWSAVALAVTMSGVAIASTGGASTGAARNPTEPSARPSVPNASCDPLDPAVCLFPFPNDYFTVADPSTRTGRRVHFDVSGMPANAAGVHVDPTEWNRSDGFSPGSLVETFVPDIDLVKSNVAPSTDIGRSLDPNAPIVIVDTQTRRRVPYWGELDTWTSDPARKPLVIRPARDFTEGHHYVVALRDLHDASGNLIPAPASFTVYRDHRHTRDRLVEARRRSMDAIFADLNRSGIHHRRDLYLAWDFTVASEQSLSGRVLRMRDDAFASLGGAAPTFRVTHVDENVSSSVLRRVQGTFDVPLYLTHGGAPGSRLDLGPNGLPVRTGTFSAEFRCLVPRAAIDAGGTVHPARAVVYGHGLLGGTDEIEGFGPIIDQLDIVLCATPWIGMAQDDIANVLTVIGDLSGFPSIPDRLQQALVNFQFLARLLKDPHGFATDPAFRVGTPAVPAHTTGEVFFNGNSQGGIIGGAATAISTEWTRAVLGVPGMNFSELIPRSVDFDPFLPLLQANYPSDRDRTLGLALLQMVWDRGEADGYAQHMTSNPLPSTPAHTVLMIEAFGDHQVANIATETEARTNGVAVHQPALQPGRSNDVTPMWGIPAIPSNPFAGSALEIWDFGTPAPPPESVPNRAGSDPHGAPRDEPRVIQQMSDFLRTDGAFVDVCGAGPCVSP